MNKQTAIEAVAIPLDNHYATCYGFSLDYIGRHGQRFTTEQMRHVYLIKGLPEPAEPRVWGAVMNRLLKEGRIKQVSWTKSVQSISHMRDLKVWERVKIEPVVLNQLDLFIK